MNSLLNFLGSALLVVGCILTWLIVGALLVNWTTDRWGDDFGTSSITWAVYCFVTGLLLVWLGGLL